MGRINPLALRWVDYHQLCFCKCFVTPTHPTTEKSRHRERSLAERVQADNPCHSEPFAKNLIFGGQISGRVGWRHKWVIDKSLLIAYPPKAEWSRIEPRKNTRDRQRIIFKNNDPAYD